MIESQLENFKMGAIIKSYLSVLKLFITPLLLN